MFLGLGVVLFKERQNSLVVSKGDLLASGEGGKGWHVTAIGIEGSQDIARKLGRA